MEYIDEHQADYEAGQQAQYEAEMEANHREAEARQNEHAQLMEHISAIDDEISNLQGQINRLEHEKESAIASFEKRW